MSELLESMSGILKGLSKDKSPLDFKTKARREKRTWIGLGLPKPAGKPSHYYGAAASKPYILRKKGYMNESENEATIYTSIPQVKGNGKNKKKTYSLKEEVFTSIWGGGSRNR